MAKILITGGTGLIGKHLTQCLLQNGHEVVLLSRDPQKSSSVQVFEWQPQNGYISEKAFEGVEHIVHLAGEGIADKRWSSKRINELKASRINTTNLLASYISKLKVPVKTFVGASAIGYYGAVTSDKIFTEQDPPSSDILGSICVDWEKSYEPIQKIGIPVSIIRIGLVLAKDGGMYKKLRPIFNSGLGSALGSGKHYMPWIHIDDLVQILYTALFNKIPSDTYNAVSSEHISNYEFSKVFAHSLNKPFFMPNVPAFVLRLLFGKMSDILLEGSRVSNQKLLDAGFKFKFQKLSEALL
jgi:uncharacterized protein (TIGR01777 family)